MAALLMIAGNLPAADAGPALLRAAVDKWADEVDRWAFVQHVREFRRDELRERRVERFDPSEPDASRWELLEVDGRPPTPAEVKAFNARKNAAPRARVESPERYIDFERCTIEREDEEVIVFKVPMRRSISLLVPFEQVDARVVVDKANRSIRDIEVGLRKEMRIAFGLARVQRLNMAFSLRDVTLPGDDEDDAPADDDAGAQDAVDAGSPDGYAKATITTFGRRFEIRWTDFERVPEREPKDDK